MPECVWCGLIVTRSEDHINFMGAYTCRPKPKNSPFYNIHIQSQTTTTLYHQTSEINANSILRDRAMYPGSSGMVGGGIYFATKPEDTNHKAQNTGVILKCQVDLGKVKDVGSGGDYSLNGQELKKQGYDSVKIPRTAGHEYAVYDSNQIKQISIHQKTGSGHHWYSANRPKK